MNMVKEHGERSKADFGSAAGTMKKYDVTALGELLIDFTENGVSGQGNPLFEANPGGAPCNVLACFQSLDEIRLLSGKSGKTFLENS